MKNAILEELVSKWEYAARPSQDRCQEDSEQGRISDAKEDARHETLKECAAEVRELIRLLPDSIITN